MLLNFLLELFNSHGMLFKKCLRDTTKENCPNILDLKKKKDNDTREYYKLIKCDFSFGMYRASEQDSLDLILAERK